jgi:hypothetical protein
MGRPPIEATAQLPRRFPWPWPQGDPAPIDLGYLIERLSREDLFAVNIAGLRMRQAQLQAELEYIGAVTEVLTKYK